MYRIESVAFSIVLALYGFTSVLLETLQNFFFVAGDYVPTDGAYGCSVHWAGGLHHHRPEEHQGCAGRRYMAFAEGYRRGSAAWIQAFQGHDVCRSVVLAPADVLVCVPVRKDHVCS